MGQALESGAQAGLQMKLSQMMEKQQQDQIMQRNAEINKKMFGIDSGVDPQIAFGLHKLIVEHGGMQRANRAAAIAAGLPVEPEGAELEEEKLPKKYDLNGPFPEDQPKPPAMPKGPAFGSLDDLKNRRTLLMQEYNKEKDPTVKKEINTSLKDVNNQIMKEREVSSKEQAQRFKYEEEPRKYIKQLSDDYNSTLKKRPIYKILESKAPELQPRSTLRRFLMERYDLPAGLLLNPTEEALEKVSQQLLRGISSDYKGRILQSEVENYVKSNPSLLNSPEGMQKLAKMQMAMDEVAEKKWKYAKDLRKDFRSKGQALPEDFEEMVLDKASEFQDESYQKINDILNLKGLQSAIPEGKVRVQDKEGNVGLIDLNRLDEAISRGAKKI
ncbi:MAG: hypothetical protein LLG04_18820 [Parachlamydia sp.]|nr:hypothetical protein [Parachlamydia sp.]